MTQSIIPMILYTSLTEIKSFNPCPRGWKNILKGQNKTQADSVLFPIADALESNTIFDICWLLGERKVEIQICVEFAKLCADSVKHLDNYYSKKAAAYTAAAAADAYAAYAAYTAYAAYAAAAAADAAADAAAAAAAAAAYNQQKEKNKQFLIQLLNNYTGPVYNHDTTT